MSTPSGAPFDPIDNPHYRLRTESENSIGRSEENVLPPPLMRARRVKMKSPLADMRTPLLILLAGLVAAPILYFFAAKFSPAPERGREAKHVAVDPQGPALALPRQPVAGTVGVAVSPSRSEASKTPAEPSVPRLSPADVQMFMKWGQEFMASGDLAAARIAFRRAAQAGDAAAALAMGSTYDPLVLQRIGALGATPDPDLARTWYERARDLGSSEAPGRINMLANR